MEGQTGKGRESCSIRPGEVGSGHANCAVLLPKGCLADHEVKLIKYQALRANLSPLLQSNKIGIAQLAKASQLLTWGCNPGKADSDQQGPYCATTPKPLVSESQTGNWFSPQSQSASLVQPHPFLGPRIPTPHTIPPSLSKDSSTGRRKLSPQKYTRTSTNVRSSQTCTEAKVCKTQKNSDFCPHLLPNTAFLLWTTRALQLCSLGWG